MSGFLLDTNILSELRKANSIPSPNPNPQATKWLAS